MTATDEESESWTRENQKYLSACIEQVKGFLKASLSNVDSKPEALPTPPSWKGNEDEGSTMPPPAIERLSRTFSLSGFERFVLIMCAAEELDSEVPKLCAKAHGSQNAAYSTFSIALAAFPDAHWSALSPTSPLRLFRLISPMGLPQVPITRCQLRIEERILHYMTGISYLDRSLQGVFEQIRDDDTSKVALVDSHDAAARTVLRAWKAARPLRAQLVGRDEASKRTVAASICRQLGLGLWQVPGELLPQRSDELELIAQLWDRESALLGAALYIRAIDLEPAAGKAVRRFLTSMSGPAFLSTSQQWQPEQDNFAPVIEISKPTKQEQRFLWESILGSRSSNKNSKNDNEEDEEERKKLADAIYHVINQFDLGAASIRLATSEAMLAIEKGEEPRAALWAASRKVARPNLAELAQPITPKAKMDDLVLGAREKDLLRSIITSARQRYRVYEEWGFAQSSDRGLGIAALFAGDSGTGKTMAAEVIANELELDLYRIDLSMVVNKYIGETEKNLKKIFDAAEDGGVILLFDEADALFGKRSEIKDSHDRYANIEIGYLLQRMESYHGLAILTTNLKNSLDKAFMRRIRFVVNFPFPDEPSRMEIWEKVFPQAVPGHEELDFAWLAKLDLAGGNIRNIALGASFLAAEDGGRLKMAHVERAAREEYDKIGRPFPTGRLAE